MPELKLHPALERPDLMPVQVRAAVTDEFSVAEIDPAFSDTESFGAHYGWDPAQAANIVLVEAVRGDSRQLAAVVVRADGRADLNGRVRKLLGARRVSMAPREEAIRESGQEFGSITAFGLPPEWPVIVDARLLAVNRLLMGGGLRRSKLVFPGGVLAELPNAQVAEDLVRG